MINYKLIGVKSDFLSQFPGYEIDRIDIPKLGEEYLYQLYDGDWGITLCETDDLKVCRIILKNRYRVATTEELFKLWGKQIQNYAGIIECPSLVKLESNDSKRFEAGWKSILGREEVPTFNSEQVSYHFIDNIDTNGNIEFSNIGYILRKE